MTSFDDATEAARERYEEALARSRAATDARIPPRFAGATVTSSDVRQWLEAVADRARQATGMPIAGRGPSLLLVGPTGTGKTLNCYGAMTELGNLGILADWRAVGAADLYAQLRPRHGVDSEQVFEAYLNCPVLIVDDLAAAKSSEWTEEVNYRLVNRRYEQEAVTLLTTNLMPPEIPEALGDRVASRLHQMAVTVALKGPDRRIHP